MVSPSQPALEVQLRPCRDGVTDGGSDLEARLLGAARERFCRSGYRATTMHAIATAARVSKATLYSHFPSKEALFRRMVLDEVDKWRSGRAFVPSEHFETLEEALQVYGDVCARTATSVEFAQTSRLVFGEAHRFPELGEAIWAALSVGVDAMAKTIEAFGQRDGAPVTNARRAAELFQTIVSGWASAAVMTNQVPSVEARTAWVNKTVRVFLAGRPAW